MKITTSYFKVADMLVNLSMPQKVQKVAAGAMKEALYTLFAKSTRYKVIPDEFDMAKNKNDVITVFGVKDAHTTDNDNAPEWILFDDISILLPDVLMEKVYVLMNKEDYNYDITLYDICSLWYDQSFGMNDTVLDLFILVDYFEQMNGIGNNGYSSIDSKKIFENFSENATTLQTVEEDGDMAKSLQELYNSYLEIKEEKTTNLIKMISLYDSYTDRFKNEF